MPSSIVLAKISMKMAKLPNQVEIFWSYYKYQIMDFENCHNNVEDDIDNSNRSILDYKLVMSNDIGDKLSASKMEFFSWKITYSVGI